MSQSQGMKLGDRKGSNSLLWLGILWMQLPRDKAMAPQSPPQCHRDRTNGISLDLELQHCPLTQIPKIVLEYQLTFKTQGTRTYLFGPPAQPQNPGINSL